jgi:hypothetical protein
MNGADHEEPKLLEVVPANSSSLFLQRLHLFAMPEGLQLTAEGKAEVISHFVALNSEGAKVFCSYYLFYPSLSKRTALFVPQAIVMVSKKAVFNIHSAVLRHFQSLISRQPQFRDSQNGLVYRPDYRELYVSTLLNALPVPRELDLEVEVLHYPPTRNHIKLPDASFFKYRRPSQFSLPNYNFADCLRCLRPENLIDVMTCLMLEHRVLLVSKHSSMLAPVAESLLSLLTPFKWKHIYIPLLPPCMLDYLGAPVPFLMGVLTGTPLPEDCVIVDLDKSVVTVPFQLPSLPAPTATLLYKTLLAIINTTNENPSKDPWIWERSTLYVKQAFFQYFMSLLENLRTPFSLEEFLAHHDNYNREFLRQLTQTMMFHSFVEASALPASLQNEEVQKFQSDLKAVAESSWIAYRQGQVELIYKQIEAYISPTKFSLYELFETYRPETPRVKEVSRAHSAREQVVVRPSNDRLVCGAYWLQLNPSYLLPFSDSSTKRRQPRQAGVRRLDDVDIYVKNLDTGELVAASSVLDPLLRDMA